MWHHNACLSDGICSYCEKGIHPCFDCGEPVQTFRGPFSDSDNPTPDIVSYAQYRFLMFN